MAEVTYEGAIITAPLEILSNQPGFQSETIALNTQTVGISAQRWELRFGVHHTNPADHFTRRVPTRFATKTMVMPQFFRREGAPSNALTGTVTVGTAASAGATTVAVRRTSGAAGVLSGARFVKFSNHDKVYLVTADLTLPNDGNANLSIFPALTEAVTTSTTLLHLDNDVVITCYESIDNLNGITYVDGVLADPGRIHLIEAL